MVIAGDKVRGTITQWTADHGNSVSFCSNGTVCWLKHHPALTGGAGQESCGEKSPALLVPGVQLRLSFKGLAPSICSYIITGLRLTTTAAWRSSGTHCAVPGWSCSFLIAADRPMTSVLGEYCMETHLLTQRHQQDTGRDKDVRSLSWATCGSVQTFQACTNDQDQAFMWMSIRRHRGENTLEGLGIKLSYWKRTGLLSSQDHVWKFMNWKILAVGWF